MIPNDRPTDRPGSERASERARCRLRLSAIAQREIAAAPTSSSQYYASSPLPPPLLPHVNADPDRAEPSGQSESWSSMGSESIRGAQMRVHLFWQRGVIPSGYSQPNGESEWMDGRMSGSGFSCIDTFSKLLAQFVFVSFLLTSNCFVFCLTVMTVTTCVRDG